MLQQWEMRILRDIVALMVLVMLLIIMSNLSSVTLVRNKMNYAALCDHETKQNRDKEPQCGHVPNALQR